MNKGVGEVRNEWKIVGWTDSQPEQPAISSRNGDVTCELEGGRTVHFYLIGGFWLIASDKHLIVQRGHGKRRYAACYVEGHGRRTHLTCERRHIKQTDSRWLTTSTL